MISSFTNDSFEWSLESGPDSVILTVKDLVHEITMNYQVILLPAWSLLWSHGQDVLNNHLMQLSKTPNQLGTLETRVEVLSCVGAQDTGKRGYQLSNLEDVELHWEDPDLKSDARFRPGTDILFSPSIFNISEIDSMAEIPILIDGEQKKENFPTHPTTTVCESPIHSIVLRRSCLFGTRIENVLVYVYRNLFEQFILLLIYMFSKKTLINVFHYIKFFLKNYSDMIDTKNSFRLATNNPSSSSLFSHISS